MTSIVNLFSNFNDLIKPKSVTDNVTEYKADVNGCNEPSFSLIQGKNFKKYQDKIENNLEKKIEKSDLVEGFEGLKDLKLDKKGLTEQTNQLLNNNDFTSQQQALSNLKNNYQTTLNEYQTLMSKVSGNTTEFIDRVSPNNPYLNKVIRLQGGYLFYVTNQGVAKYFPDNTVYMEVSGKNGFPPAWNLIDVSIPFDNNYSTPGATIPTKPPLITGTHVEVGESVGNEGVNVFVNSVVKNPQSSYVGCYNNIPSGTQNTSEKTAMTNAGQMNFEQCQTYAVNTGNLYFGLQSVNSNGEGNCMISNDLAGSQINGPAINYINTSLWNSNTIGNNQGSTASFNNGSITVLNSSGAAIFSTPNNTAQPSNYIGCYGDKSKRAMTVYNKGSQKYTNATCQEAAIKQKAKYYGLQNSKSGKNAQCFTSNSLSQTQKYGVAKNCTQISDGSWSGGGWSNAVYSTSTPTLNYFLILQDDGNMCIYLGSGPSDNQGLVWQSGTNGNQQSPNPNFAAEKGKYGKNWISNGSTLSSGDFIGSTNGDMYLIMQSDGNLVLYTSTTSSKCSSYGNNTVGAENANAIYQIGEMGNKASVGKLAYIDQNSALHSYPNNNLQYSNIYTTYKGNDSIGNDIYGASYGNATVEQCQTTCNSNPKCAGFAFSNNVCYPKTSSMFPNGNLQNNPNVNLYTRNKAPINPPIGVPGTVVNIDSILYDNYKNGGTLANSYGLANATSVQKEQISQLQSKLNLLTSQINGYTNKFSSGTESLNSQSSKNIKGLGDYLNNFKNTNNNIKNLNSANIENILNDSDITVLQKNYDYLFWSILATGTVLITMNIAKTQ
jgi:hypothetical protein